LRNLLSKISNVRSFGKLLYQPGSPLFYDPGSAELYLCSGKVILKKPNSYIMK